MIMSRPQSLYLIKPPCRATKIRYTKRNMPKSGKQIYCYTEITLLANDNEVQIVDNGNQYIIGASDWFYNAMDETLARNFSIQNKQTKEIVTYHNVRVKVNPANFKLICSDKYHAECLSIDKLHDIFEAKFSEILQSVYDSGFAVDMPDREKDQTVIWDYTYCPTCSKRIKP